MPSAFRFLLLLLLTVWSVASPAAVKPNCARPLSLALHEHGLLYSSRTGEGIDKDIADELIRRSGCKISITVMPRARIWQLIEAGSLDFSLSGIANEARLQFASFAWYESNKYYLLLRKDAGVTTLSDFERNPALMLGVIRGFRYNPVANRFVDALDDAHRVSFATSLEPLYQVLLDNRVQAMIIEPFDYPAIERSEIRAQTTVVEFDDPAVPHGLIMSKRSLSTTQQNAWRALVDEMRADGTVRRIYEKYFSPELARALTQY